jgi:hypothetical protein
MERIVLTAVLAVAASACTVPAAVPAVQQVPDNLRQPATEQLLGAVTADGVQIYECRAKGGEPQSTEWVFIAPEATLLDSRGRIVGKHYAGPHWESTDGSKIVGSVSARADAPHAGAIPWLLLTTQSVGTAGAFANVTAVQRVHTVGGLAPAVDECAAQSLGRQVRVAYRADYVMFGPTR